MKSLKAMAAMAIAAATFSACGNSSAPKADLKTDLDSMSYAIGYLQSQYVRQAIEQGQVVDTAVLNSRREPSSNKGMVTCLLLSRGEGQE